MRELHPVRHPQRYRNMLRHWSFDRFNVHHLSFANTPVFCVADENEFLVMILFQMELKVNGIMYLQSLNSNGINYLHTLNLNGTKYLQTFNYYVIIYLQTLILNGINYLKTLDFIIKVITHMLVFKVFCFKKNNNKQTCVKNNWFVTFFRPTKSFKLITKFSQTAILKTA